MGDDERWEIDPKVLKMIRDGAEKFRGIIERKRDVRHRARKEEKR